MISQRDLVYRYNKLYEEARRYIWNYVQVEALANLEIAIYKLCPDLNEIRNALSKYYMCCIDAIREDEELENAFNTLRSLAESEDTVYTPIDKVEETLV